MRRRPSCTVSRPAWSRPGDPKQAEAPLCRRCTVASSKQNLSSGSWQKVVAKLCYFSPATCHLLTSHSHGNPHSHGRQDWQADCAGGAAGRARPGGKRAAAGGTGCGQDGAGKVAVLSEHGLLRAWHAAAWETGCSTTSMFRQHHVWLMALAAACRE